MELPIRFQERMKKLLGEEYKEYEESFDRPHFMGLRVNTLKITPEEFIELSPFALEPIPWTENGFYYKGEQQPAKHPYHFAGLYYIQEPSAMTPAAMLPIEEGDRVLDLCAAPGGKSTELAAKLNGTGILVSNDISNSRAQALLRNLERFGVRNALVVSESPEKLSSQFTEYFDKILVDAPCSGEGMFRKDQTMIKSWEKTGVEYYSKLQKEIILEAAKMLKPGGKLLYSTCTFSPEENEETILYLLKECPEFKIIPMKKVEGFEAGRPDWVEGGMDELKNCVRLWPHKINGEGHFLALLQKGEEKTDEEKKRKKRNSKVPEEVEKFMKQIDTSQFMQNYEIKGEYVNIMPEEFLEVKGIRLLRKGIYLGDLKKNRFEPSQAFAMALKKEECQPTITLDVMDENVIRYLKGETIEVEETKKKGYHLICVGNYPLGWGKLNQGTVKNKYHPGWRWQ